eukprot:450780-Pyramimonas_sp.AAC.1
MLSLQQASVDKCDGDGVDLEESPVGDRAADGLVENAAKITRLMFADACSRYSRDRAGVSRGHPVALWAIGRAKSVINRFR